MKTIMEKLNLKKSLDRLADQNFENFEDFENYLDCYTGDGDDFVDFPENVRNFAAHNEWDRTFTINVSIPASSTVTRLQMFGNLLLGSNIVKGVNTGMIKDGTDAVTGITCSGSPYNIVDLYAWLQQQPTVLKGFQIASSSTSVLSGIIVRNEESPFRTLSTRPINLSAYRNEYMFNNQLLTIKDINDVISNQTFWYIPIPASTALTFTINLYFGASMNSSIALENKQNRAMNNIARLGGNAVARALVNKKTAVKGVDDVKSVVNASNSGVSSLMPIQNKVRR